MRTAVDAHLAALGLPPLPAEAEEKLRLLSARLREENEKYNLTAITDPEEIAVRHFADSLTAAAVLPEGPLRLIDVGCGGGFPGLPLKIYLDAVRGPQALSITLLDATEKKVGFLAAMCAELALPGAEPLHGRAEELGRSPDRREAYDGALSRAVASMDKLDELCLPFCRPGGFFACLKSAAGRAETEAAAAGVARLGGGTPVFRPYRLPGEETESLLVFIPKERPTPGAYPRAWGAIKKRPL